jgi:hypothetical protein
MKETDSNKEFIPYEQAVALKELGFEEYCLRYFIMGILNPTNLTVNYDYFKEMIEINPNMLKHTYVLAPLYQQAFSFLVKLQDEFKVSLDEKGWYIYDLNDNVFYGDDGLHALINTVKFKQK